MDTFALKENVMQHRDICMLEIIARLQTILKAHLAIGTRLEAAQKLSATSKMEEFEMFTAPLRSS